MPLDWDRLIELLHPDPHSVLGPHGETDGLVIRAFRPGALSMSVVPDEFAPVPMILVHPAGIFEARFGERRDPFAYELEARFPGGAVQRERDPYSYLPTLGELDVHLAREGQHERLYERLGAHRRGALGPNGSSEGVSFAVWAPSARGISVVGDFNGWDGRRHLMRNLGFSGIWEIFVPGLSTGAAYKFEIRTTEGDFLLKADPYASWAEKPPASASRVYQSRYRFGDAEWETARPQHAAHREPLSIYEVHLGSWRRSPDHPREPLSYRDLAEPLAAYVKDLGFTHVELMPVMEHPFGGSWGYQVTSYFAPTSRYGEPDDFRAFVDTMHRHGIGVILDWVPAHFPRDEFSLGRFDGTALYEHLDPRMGHHPDWDTYIFNYGRNEVRNFLMSNALYWLSEFHADGLRVDAVASMLYLDYSRKEGEWVPNRFGGRENLDAVDFIRQVNELAYARRPGTLMIAEESTAWPGVSRPIYLGGLGFGFKWNMGWMHDTLTYFTKDPVHRKYHHDHLTFGLLYAWSENFILPLSHDEVVHGKRSLLSKMPGDRWQQFANLRALYGYMWAHPGKKMLFMGGEFGQWDEWNVDASLDWHLLVGDEHRGVTALIRDLNRLYRESPALWEADGEPAGFAWIDVHNADENVVAFRRISPATGREIVCVCNFSPVVRRDYRVGLPRGGEWREILNTDSSIYAGGNVGNGGAVHADPRPWHGYPFSAPVVLPPLATVWLEAP
jgi:1,4-alpha-glucan branching enzyme